MIAFLKGRVLRLGPSDVVLDVNGVGYQIFVTPATVSQLQIAQPLSLEIFTVVREDQISLYGFASYAERDLFNLLLSANGVGPKIALSILSQTRLPELVVALRQENFAYLKNIKGLGEKTTKVLMATLKNKLDHVAIDAELRIADNPMTGSLQKEAQEALMGLGFSREEVRGALAKVALTSGETLEGVIKASLKSLSQGGA